MTGPERMPARHALYVALAAAAVAFAIAFVWPAFRPTPVLWYYPLENRWAFQIAPDGLAMDWYGRTLMAVLLSSAALAVTYALARLARPLSRRAFALWASWLATAVLLAMALYVHQLANRHPVPVPLPGWYTPR